ncbi:MAG: hypothetical protein IJW69_00850 [Clostridia bacterium]|nr:hypothetical protein [Clostridia bacterium]
MNNNTVARELFEGFSGLGLSSARGKGAHRLDNFRVLADGSLEKREGIRQIAALPADIRGIYGFVDGVDEVVLAVSSNNLYRISAEGEQVTFAPCFETESGEVSFFEYEGILYLLDGAQVYRYEGGCEAVKVCGYTPMYGVNWVPHSNAENNPNQPNEAINLFSPYVRIHYVTSGYADRLFVGLEIKQIRWVRGDEGLLTSGEYSLSEDKNTVIFSGRRYDSEVEICIALADRYWRDSDFISTRAAAVYEAFDKSRVFFYGGNNPSALYISVPLNGEARKSDRELFPESCGLYFPKTKEVVWGGGQPITAVGRIYDRMTVFFPSSLWVTERLEEVEGQGVQLVPICHHMGCVPKHAAVMTGAASPISVTYDGIYRWRIDADLLDECTATKISGEVRALLGESFLENAEICHRRGRAELWFRDRSRVDGQILIYHLERGVWYSYSGLEADLMFAFGGGIGLVRGGRVFLFDESLSEDRFADGEREIKAVYESGWLEFDGVGAEKRLAGATLIAALDGGGLSVTLEDGEPLAEVELSEHDAVAPDIYEPRMPSCRFRTARLTLVADGAARQRIYRAELLAQKGKQ